MTKTKQNLFNYFYTTVKKYYYNNYEVLKVSRLKMTNSVIML